MARLPIKFRIILHVSKLAILHATVQYLFKMIAQETSLMLATVPLPLNYPTCYYKRTFPHAI